MSGAQAPKTEHGLARIQEVADAYGTSKNHLMKQAYDLGRHGILETVRGRGGGLRLAQTPEKIDLGDVVHLLEEHFSMVECFSPDANACSITGPGRLKGVLREALNAYLTVPDKHTLADLTGCNPALSKLLLAG